MGYNPWPADGCTLAEARERTADRSKSRDWQRFVEEHRSFTARPAPRKDVVSRDAHDDEVRRKGLESSIFNLEASIEAEFRQQLIEGRLLAYGRRGGHNGRPELIPAEAWPNLNHVDWSASVAAEKRSGGKTFTAIRVFPLLLAPACVERVAGRNLADIFRAFVLEDPEVMALAQVAIAASPIFENVFHGGHCFVRGCKEWPLQRGAEPVGAIRADQDRRATGILAASDPDAVIEAADAVANRFHRLLEPLRSGALVGRAVLADDGKIEQILQPVWAHADFWLDAQKGNVLQVNPNCDNPPHDFLQRRWVGVVLDRAETTHASRSAGDSLDLTSRTGKAVDDRPFTSGEIVAAESFGPALNELVLHHPRIQTLRQAARLASQRSGHPLYEEGGLLTRCYGHDEKLLPVKFASRDKYENALTEEDLDDIDEIFRPSIPREFSELYHALNSHLFWLFEALRRQELYVVAHTVDGSRVTINHTIWSHDEYYILPRTSDIFEARGPRMIRRWVGAAFAASEESNRARTGTVAPNGNSHSAAWTSMSDQDRAERQSSTQASIDAAVIALWPEGIPKSLPVKVRNQLIQNWQRANGVAVAGDKSIYRHLRRKLP